MKERREFQNDLGGSGKNRRTSVIKKETFWSCHRLVLVGSLKGRGLKIRVDHYYIIFSCQSKYIHKSLTAYDT